MLLRRMIRPTLLGLQIKWFLDFYRRKSENDIKKAKMRLIVRNCDLYKPSRSCTM